MALWPLFAAPSHPPNEGPIHVKTPRSHRDDPSRGGCDCLPHPAETEAEREALAKPAPGAEPTFAVDPAAAGTAYVLRYEDRWFGFEKRVAFSADDVAAAIEMMEHEPIGRWAELWHEGQLVCRRGRAASGETDYWSID